MAGEAFIISGIALLGICVTILFKRDSILKNPIDKTDDEIKFVLKKLNPNSSNISNDIDEICRLQRRKKHLHKDIQNIIALFTCSSFGLIMISLESMYFGNDVVLEKLITKILIFIVGFLVFFGFCFIFRFSIEANKIKSNEKK